MQQLRGKELELLRCFLSLCERLHLRYFVVQGTLLGAVRHQGFIPWDDDIDVGMLREDYEVFVKEAQHLLPTDVFLQTCATDPGYPQGFAKIRSNGTAFVETTCKNLQMNHGIYIDIFPFDYYPDSAFQRFRIGYRKLLLRYRIRCGLYVPQDRRISVPNLARWLLMGISRLYCPSWQAAVDRQSQLYSETDHGSRRINHGSPWGKRECVPAFWLEDAVDLKFEGISVKAPGHYEQYLTHVYGDYMTLPPPEKRIPHHYISFVDFTGPYTRKIDGIDEPLHQEGDSQ